MDKIKKELIGKKRSDFDLIWPKKFLVEILCPLCSEHLSKTIYPQYYPRIKKCNNCGLIYTNPRLKELYLRKLYSRDYFQNKNSSTFGYQNYLEDQKKIKTTFRKRLKEIEKIKSPGKLLDVGCALGFFMETASENGWQVEGVEISKFAADYIKKNPNFTTFIGDFQKIDLKTKQYDLITLWDVIEHLTNPADVFKKIHTLLKEDGLIVITTPDVGSFPAKITKHRWVGYKLSDEHLTYFSYQTLERILDLAGFKIIKSHHVGKYVSFSMFSDRVGLYSRRISQVLSLLNHFLPRDFSFYVSALDIICVYAVKK